MCVCVCVCVCVREREYASMHEERVYVLIKNVLFASFFSSDLLFCVIYLSLRNTSFTERFS